jgi:hypothetical protein
LRRRQSLAADILSTATQWGANEREIRAIIGINF